MFGSCRGRRLPDGAPFREIIKEEGNFCFIMRGDPARRHMLICLPGFEFISISLGGEHGWILTGPLDQPTVRPSIRTRSIKPDGTSQEVWHGYLTAGRFVGLGEKDDSA